ncbi:MAG: YigZ family protein [Bacteroidales bacterium]|nr:YigZ family protein [Bacteroidales bacterium]
MKRNLSSDEKQVHLQNLFFLSFVSKMDDEYRTLEKPAEGIYREKGSRFLAFGYPAGDEESAREIIAGLKKEHHNARHHCYAYRMGRKAEIYRMNDDGEPSGTAGRPIYGTLLSNGLNNVLIVVVRYFGGVLLGRNRLANAYKTAAQEMLSGAQIVTGYIENACRITFPYSQMNDVMKVMKEENVTPVKPIYGNMVSFYARIKRSCLSGFLGKLKNIDGLSFEPVDHIP